MATNPWAPLRIPAFRHYWLSFTVNTLGSTMAPVALAFAVLHVSNSPTSLGLVLASNTIPMVLLLLFGGVVADRLPRDLILRVAAVVTGTTQTAAAFLVVTDRAELWMLAALEAVNGAGMALIMPAFSGLVPQLVPRTLLQEANVLLSVSRGGLRVVGPTVSAALVVGVGPGWALGVDALTWFVAAGLLRIGLPARAPGEEEPSVIGELREGWTFFRQTTWLWVVVLAFGFLNAIHTGAWFTLGPARAKETFGAQGWGLLLSAESVGVLVLTAVMMRRRLGRPLRWGMAGIAVLGLPIFVLGAHPSLPLLIPLAFAAGIGIELFSLGWTLAMQENVEERMLSRAYSYDSLGSFVAMPVGQLVYGPLGAHFGVRDVLVVSGVAYVAIALACLTSRSVRDLGRAPVGASA